MTRGVSGGYNPAAAERSLEIIKRGGFIRSDRLAALSRFQKLVQFIGGFVSGQNRRPKLIGEALMDGDCILSVADRRNSVPQIWPLAEPETY